MMNRIYLLLTSCFLLTQVWAAIPNNGAAITAVSQTDLPAEEVAENRQPARYQMSIQASGPAFQMEQYLEADTAEGLLQAELSRWETLSGMARPANEVCTVSITVTVRVGWDSNFAEASGTVEGIPCDDVVSAIRRLRDQLMAGIK